MYRVDINISMMDQFSDHMPKFLIRKIHKNCVNCLLKCDV
jgi:hypothetical protein